MQDISRETSKEENFPDDKTLTSSNAKIELLLYKTDDDRHRAEPRLELQEELDDYRFKENPMQDSITDEQINKQAIIGMNPNSISNLNL